MGQDHGLMRLLWDAEESRMSIGISKKQNRMASDRFTILLGECSKVALIDALWCACQLGTDESEQEITAPAARNVVIALELRGDRIPKGMREAASVHIDSDPPQKE